MTATPRNRCLIGIVLFLSLALNVFLFGWMFGADKLHEPPHGRGMFFDVFNEKAATLPPDERQAVEDVLGRYQPQMRKQMRRIMRTRDAIDTMYGRDDYSREEAETRFNTLQDQSLTMQQLMQAMMLDLADVLPPEKRAKFMERPKDWRGHGEEFKPKPKAKPAAPAPAATPPISNETH